MLRARFCRFLSKKFFSDNKVAAFTLCKQEAAIIEIVKNAMENVSSKILYEKNKNSF